MSYDWVFALITLAASTAVTTIVGLLIKRYFDKYVERKDKEAQEAKENEKKLKELEEEKRRQERKEDVLLTMREELGPVIEKLDKLAEVIEYSREGTVTLLRELMKWDKDNFGSKGFVTAAEDASWHELYNTYKKLGGNHFKEWVDAWKEDVESLPREAPKKKTTRKKSTKKSSSKIPLNESK